VNATITYDGLHGPSWDTDNNTADFFIAPPDPRNSSFAPVPPIYVSALNVTKEAEGGEGPYNPGDTITYNITVCNIGNRNLTNVTVNDTLLGVRMLGNLTKGACNWTVVNYTVKEVDACTGWVNNTVNVSAKDSCNTTIYNQTSKNVTVTYVSALNVMKTPAAGTYYPGDTITYNITVCNIGNLNLTSVTVNDSLLGLVDLGTLEPGACNWTERNYTVTADDACRGWINNTFVAKGMGCGDNWTYSDPDVVTITVPCPSGDAADDTPAIKDVYYEGEPVYALGSGFAPNTLVDIYIFNDRKWLGGEDLTAIAPLYASAPGKQVDPNGSIGINPLVLVWANSVPGEYDMVFDANQNHIYEPFIDAVDDPNHPGLIVLGRVPLITPLGIVVLIGLLSLIATSTLVRKRKN
jgi:uncharacterized repeat protein (TIGR01451 family)